MELKSRKPVQALQWISACFIIAGAGILPLVWVVIPVGFFADITRKESFNFAYSVASTGAAVVMLLSAAIILFLLRRRFGAGKGYLSFGLAVVFNAALILRLFITGLTGKDFYYFPWTSTGNFFTGLFFIFAVALYVLLFASCIRAYAFTARKAGRALLLLTAAICTLSFIFGLFYLGQGYFTTFNPFPYDYYKSIFHSNSYLKNHFFQVFLNAVTVPFALTFILRTIAPLMPLREKAAADDAHEPEYDKSLPSKPLDPGVTIVSLAILIICAALICRFVQRPRLNLTVVGEIGTTFQEFVDKNGDELPNYNNEVRIWDRDDGGFSVRKRDDGAYDYDEFVFSESATKEDSLCIGVIVSSGIAIFLNQDYYPYHIDDDSLSKFARHYSLTYLGAAMSDYSDLPVFVFQNEKYRFYFMLGFDGGRINFRSGFGKIAIFRKPGEDEIYIPEIMINSVEELAADASRPLFAFDVFNGLTETGYLSTEDFADKYHLTIIDEKYTYWSNRIETHTVIYESEGYQFTLEFKSHDFSLDLRTDPILAEYITPFMRVTISNIARGEL